MVEMYPVLLNLNLRRAHLLLIQITSVYWERWSISRLPLWQAWWFKYPYHEQHPLFACLWHLYSTAYTLCHHVHVNTVFWAPHNITCKGYLYVGIRDGAFKTVTSEALNGRYGDIIWYFELKSTIQNIKWLYLVGTYSFIVSLFTSPKCLNGT